MTKWEFEDLEFIEIDGKIYVEAEAVAEKLDQMKNIFRKDGKDE